MPSGILISFKGQELDIPHCGATTMLAILPGMEITQNQAWGLIHAMEPDDNQEVQAARSQLSELAGPLPAIAGQQQQ